MSAIEGEAGVHGDPRRPGVTRTALVLATIALAFFFGIMIKYLLLGK